jgi:hypothetical protein
MSDVRASVDAASDSTPQGEDSEPEDVPDELVKVMVVEDNMVNRKILVKILSSKLVSNHVVFCANW